MKRAPPDTSEKEIKAIAEASLKNLYLLGVYKDVRTLLAALGERELESQTHKSRWKCTEQSLEIMKSERNALRDKVADLEARIILM